MQKPQTTNNFDFGKLFQNPKNKDILNGQYNILLLGGTGQGKTAFLNLLMNCNSALNGLQEMNNVKQEHDTDLENT